MLIRCYVTAAFLKNRNLADFSKYVSLNVIGMIAFNCYILADTFFVANGIGLTALTSLNLALPAFSVLSGLGLMVGMGGATKFAILKSEGKDGNAAFFQSLTLAVFFSIILVLFGAFLSDQISYALGADSETLGYTSRYISVLFYFAPAFLINNVLTCFVRNDNNPALAMIAVAAGSISNVILDYAFIFPLQMGIFGAILATGLAPVISILILSFHWLTKRCTVKLRFAKPKLAVYINIFHLGVFSLVAEIANGVAILLFNTIILKIVGKIGVAAFGVVENIFFVAIAFFTGISQGIQPLVSKRYGENRVADMRKILRYGLTTAFAIAAIVYIIVAVIPAEITELFNSENNPDLVKYAVPGLRLYFIGLFFAGINIVGAGFFSATERGGRAFAISILRGFAVLVPSAYLMSYLLGMTGVWISLPITEALVALICVFLLINVLKTLKKKQIELPQLK